MITPRPRPPHDPRRARSVRGAPPGPRRAGRSDRWQATRAAAWASVLAACILAGFGVVAMRVVAVQVQPHPVVEEAVQARRSARPLRASRGSIIDRAGRPIATSIPAARVFVDPVSADEAGVLATVATSVADRLGLDAATLDRRLQEAMTRNPETKFVPLTDPLPSTEVASLIPDLGRGELRGVGLEPREIRISHTGGVADTLVGMTGFENTGLTGLEHSLDARLAGEDGRIAFRRASSSHAIWLSPGDHLDAIDGETIRLSMDLSLQAFAAARLKQAVTENNALGGRIIVVKAETGEILAMHDTLQDRQDDFFGPPTDAQLKWLEMDPAARGPRSATDPFEPGSTFKAFAWAICTQAGVVRPQERLATPPDGRRIRINRRSIGDSHAVENASWHDCLVHSLNTGMAIAAMRLQSRDRWAMRDAILDLGFGTPTGVGFPSETAGIVTSRKNWSYYSQTSVSFGQEIAVTPLQLARAFCVFARDGSMPPLTLLARPDGGRVSGRPIFDPEIARMTRDIMHEVTTTGSPGNRAFIESKRWTSFGKTGTAELANPAGGIFRDRYTSSYIAGAPLEDPKVVVLCVIDDPDRRIRHYGRSTAGPVVRDVFERALEIMGVPEDGIEATQARDDDAVDPRRLASSRFGD